MIVFKTCIMKKILLIILLAPIVFASCNFVGNPQPEVNANLGDTTSCFTPTFPVITSHIKKILIEDYTGHTCGNCPNAAEELHTLDSLYPGKIVGLALHVDGLAAPAPGHLGAPSTAFTSDFRTAVGEDYDATFGCSDFGLPAGMFNRKYYDATVQSHLLFYGNWQAYITPIISEASVVDLQIGVDFNLATRKICFAVKDSFLNASPISDTLKLVVVLVQDSIIDWQYNGSANIPNYLHRHVLRDAITPSGAWGESLVSGSIPVGTTHIKKYAYNIPNLYKNVPCDVNQCHIIAFIYKTSTYEIIQAEEVKLIP